MVCPGARRILSKFSQTAGWAPPAAEFTNPFGRPPRGKNLLFVLFQEFLRANGAAAALMSGSGSTTFALVESRSAAEQLAEKFKQKFGASCWMAVVPV